MLEIADLKFVQKNLVIPARLERATLSLEGRCSIQLSYGTAGEKVNYQRRLEKLRGFKAHFEEKSSKKGLKVTNQ